MNSDDSIIDDFALQGKIYLNNASVSVMPISSIKAMNDFLVEYNAIGPDSSASESFIEELLMRTRKIISKIIKCQPDEIVFTQSTTDGINIVANGINFNKNANIIIRGEEHEHHANYYPWLRLRKKITVNSLPIDKNGLFELESLKINLNESTQLVALSHALYNTGAILPVEKIGEILEKTNSMYFLDSAQTIGCIGDFDVKSTKCNFMSFNGSKWLCGPMGTGLFYCSRSSSSKLEPAGIGGESAMTYDKTSLAYKDLPDKFQTGFRNYVGIAGLEASANYLYDFGLDKIRNKVIRLANLLREEINNIQGVTIFGPEDSESRTSIVSFTIKGKNPEEVVKLLEKKNIIIAVREILDKKIIRISPHFFNNENEMGKVVSELKKL